MTETRTSGKGNPGAVMDVVLPVARDPAEGTREENKVAGTPSLTWSETPPEEWTKRLCAADDDGKHFLRPSWLKSWWSAYGSTKKWSAPLRYLSVVSDERLLGVMPVAFQNAYGLRFATLAGNYQPFRSIAVFEKPALSANRMVAGIEKLKGIDGVNLGPALRTDKDITLLAEAFSSAGWRVIKKAIGTCYSIAVPATVEKFENSLTPKRKKRSRYYWNRMRRSGETELVHYNGINAECWKPVFDDLAVIERASWVSKEGDPRFAGARDKLFWSCLTGDRWMCQALHAWVIYHRGAPVSFCFAVDSGGIRYIIANSYDARVAIFSTGSTIYREVVIDAIKRGYNTINIGMGDSGYKSRWGAVGGAEFVNILAFPPTLKGSLVHQAARAKIQLDSFASRFDACAKD